MRPTSIGAGEPILRRLGDPLEEEKTVAKAKTTKKTSRSKSTSKQATAKSGTKARAKATKSSTKKKSATTKKDTTVTVDRRNPQKKDRRDTEDRRQTISAVEEERREMPERRKVARRRQIDPTTCERDYNNDEIEFMHALDAYKRAAGRMFPTCSEILEVLRDLGYHRLTPEEIAQLRPAAVQVEGDGETKGTESSVEEQASTVDGAATESTPAFPAESLEDFDG